MFLAGRPPSSEPMLPLSQVVSQTEHPVAEATQGGWTTCRVWTREPLTT